MILMMISSRTVLMRLRQSLRTKRKQPKIKTKGSGLQEMQLFLCNRKRSRYAPRGEINTTLHTASRQPIKGRLPSVRAGAHCSVAKRAQAAAPSEILHVGFLCLAMCEESVPFFVLSLSIPVLLHIAKHKKSYIAGFPHRAQPLAARFLNYQTKVCACRTLASMIGCLIRYSKNVLLTASAHPREAFPIT